MAAWCCSWRIESACIPLPSELIMPFAGYLVFQGELTPVGRGPRRRLGLRAGLTRGLLRGCSGVGGHWCREYGRYLLISQHDLELADRWFARHGDITILVGRLLPVVRTFIAFPAGVARMAMLKFLIYTFVGSLIWCWGSGLGGAAAGRALGHPGDIFPSLRCADSCCSSWLAPPGGSGGISSICATLTPTLTCLPAKRILAWRAECSLDTLAYISDSYLIAPI